GGPALAASTGLVFGPDGNLYVSTQAHTVVRYDGTTGAFLSTFVTANSGPLFAPGAITFGPGAILYVTTYSGPSSSIRRYTSMTGSFIDKFVSDADAAAADLLVLNGITFGPDGRLYVTNIASSGRNSVAVFNGKTGAFIEKLIEYPAVSVPRAVVFTPRP